MAKEQHLTVAKYRVAPEYTSKSVQYNQYETAAGLNRNLE